VEQDQFITNTAPQPKTRNLLRKFNLFLFFLFQVLFIEACHLKLDDQDIRLTDEIRNSHAEQLLHHHDLTPLREFNGDRQFNRYISQFIEKRNKRGGIDADKFTNSLLNISRMHSYDPIFLLAVIQTESSFNPNAIGTVGEVGLMQLKPETAEWICDKNNIVWRGANALKDPEYNLLLGSYYFQYLRRTLRSESYKYITAYNMGIKGLSKADEEKLKENNYFTKVIGNYMAIYSELKKIKKRNNRV
jgi:soluble lytic murein transglycosylase